MEGWCGAKWRNAGENLLSLQGETGITAKEILENQLREKWASKAAKQKAGQKEEQERETARQKEEQERREMEAANGFFKKVKSEAPSSPKSEMFPTLVVKESKDTRLASVVSLPPLSSRPCLDRLASVPLPCLCRLA
eukprot:Gregarina_sp_Pseudo_9__3094@NODE_3290_length_690_cov_106_937020_g3004_i0_p1_GENE_NODE_3290_length_690_cov_106_937020_g3004_i0NODE_3290_length_690_cov_106_937020_g3004_i0_p1_ORF_typecomplete_len137_score25_40Caldesmon/PF02029_15/0_002eIF3_subunit/PF08597_10/0_0059Rap1DNAbind/PF09197_10/0_085Hydin_ADK/PF17213_3/0_12Protocadherin/PF08374_11/0_29BRD4_CDT/PF17105_5/2_9EIIBCGUT_N/PF03612_14/4_8_NODE_3290_length_690_cov_106_937020_g3004_i0137547